MSFTRRGKFFYVKADLTKQKEQALKYAEDRIYNDAEVKKYVKYVYVDPNCNLMAFTRTCRFMKFNLEVEFEYLILHVDNTTRESEKIYDMIGDQLQSLCPRE